MKKIFICLIALVGLCSCESYLDKEDDTELTMDQVFDNKILTERWLGGVYSCIPDPYWGWLNTEGWDILADDVYASERWQQWGWNTIPWLRGNVNTSTGWSGDHWAKMPKCIRQANIFMQRVHALPAEGLSSDEVALMKLECRFLKAYAYWQMLNTYGPIPFEPEYLASTEASAAELMFGPTSYDEIVDWLDKELKELSQELPASYTDMGKYGRATSIMCLAVRARMLLYAASPLVNGNPDYADFRDREGNNLFSTSYDPSKWTKAAEACRELIDAAHANGHKLYVEYNEDGSIDPFSSYQNLFLPLNANNCPEILFARPDCDYGSYENHSYSKGEGGNGGLGVYQEFVDAFFMENGLLIDDPNSGYVEDGFSTEDEVRYTAWNGRKQVDKQNMIINDAGTYNMYTHREPRFYVSINYQNAYFKVKKRNFDMVYLHKDNIGTHDAPQTGYLLRKRVHPDFEYNVTSHPYRPGIVYRLGEAYLNYAEALNECGGDPTQMLFYLNEIRKRAGLRTYTTGATDSENIHVNAGDQDEMRRLIWAERRIELGCEGLRYHDIRRWKKGEEWLNGSFTGMNAMDPQTQNDPDKFFQRVEIIPRVYRKALYWIPIYQDEIDKNPNLVQAPYWDATDQ